MADPTYVRLPNRLIRGCVVDLNSGWSLSGLDVAQFPSDRYPAAQEFVRRAIRDGRLEEAASEEYDKVHGDHMDLLSETGVETVPLHVQATWQAAQHHQLADEIRYDLEGDRGFGSGAAGNYEADQKRREELIAASKGDKKAQRGAARSGAESPVNDEDPQGRENQATDGSQEQPPAPGGDKAAPPQKDEGKKDNK
jgi:hypothetical protein